MKGRQLEQRERYFLVRASHDAVDVTNWTEEERDWILEHRWWALDEMGRSAERFVPTQIARGLADLIAGRIPREPIAIGV